MTLNINIELLNKIENILMVKCTLQEVEMFQMEPVFYLSFVNESEQFKQKILTKLILTDKILSILKRDNDIHKTLNSVISLKRINEEIDNKSNNKF